MRRSITFNLCVLILFILPVAETTAQNVSISFLYAKAALLLYGNSIIGFQLIIP